MPVLYLCMGMDRTAQDSECDSECDANPRHANPDSTFQTFFQISEFDKPSKSEAKFEKLNLKFSAKMRELGPLSMEEVFPRCITTHRHVEPGSMERIYRENSPKKHLKIAKISKGFFKFRFKFQISRNMKGPEKGRKVGRDMKGF